MDDISFLVNETFKNVENVKDAHGDVPGSCGILYSLAENESTYVIRAIASKNLNNDFKNLFKDKKNEKLRVEKEDGSDVFWFKTPFWELSELIIELATQKRFLKKSQSLTNLSDPHLSWLISENEDRLCIDLSGKRTHRENYHSMGYLGESSIATVRFAQLLNISADVDEVVITRDENTELFNKLKDLFIYDSYNEEWFQEYLEDKYSSNLAESMSLYLRELSVMLGFWKQIFSQIKIN